MPNRKEEDKDPNKGSKLSPVEKPKRRTRTKKGETVKVDIASIPNIDNAEQIEANKIASAANDISRKSKNVNAALLVITIVLAFISMCQYKSSSDAVTVAKNSLDSSAKYSRKTLEIQIAANKSADSTEKEKFKRDTAAFNLQKRSVEAQITAIKENHNQFIKINEPYIQIFQPKLIDYEIGKHPFISLEIVNLKETPVKIIKSKYAISRGTENPLVDTFKLINTPHSINQYIIKGSPLPNQMPFYSPVTEKEFKEQREKGTKIFIVKELEYLNLITNKKRIYKVLFSVEPIPNGSISRFLYNRNYDAN